jgi:MFS transporter, DHA1 family, tetracycline resistance protein
MQSGLPVGHGATGQSLSTLVRVGRPLPLDSEGRRGVDGTRPSSATMERARRLKRSPLAVLFMAVLVDMLGFGIVIPVLPFYALEMEATALQVTILIASFSAMQMVATPVWGRVSDRRGRRPLIIAGLFASAVSYLIFGLAQSLLLLLVSRMAAGAAGGTISVAHAYVADTTRAEERAHAMGLIGAAAGLGVMIGPAIGGLVSNISLSAPGYVAAALCALNAVAAIFLLPESRPRAGAGAHSSASASLGGWLRAMTSSPLALLLAIYFLGITSFTAMTALLALYFERVFDIGARDMGILFSIAGGVTVVVRGVVLGRLVRRFGEIATVRVGAVSLGLAMILVPLVPSFGWALATVPLYALGAGTLFPALATLTSLAADADSQGSILGGSQFVGGLGRVLGPLWAGFLFQAVTIRTPFHVAAVCAAAALTLAIWIPPALQSRSRGAAAGTAAGTAAGAAAGTAADAAAGAAAGGQDDSAATAQQAAAPARANRTGTPAAADH